MKRSMIYIIMFTFSLLSLSCGNKNELVQNDKIIPSVSSTITPQLIETTQPTKTPRPTVEPYLTETLQPTVTPIPVQISPSIVTPNTSPDRQESESGIISSTDNRKLSDIKNFELLQEYSSWIELENWGGIYFSVGIDTNENNLGNLEIYLVDETETILYRFPEFYGNLWIYSEVDSIGFQDLNNDGYKDVIIIEWVTSPAGVQDEFLVAGVYFQKGKEFINQPDVNKEINDEYQNENIDMITEYVRKMDIKLD